MFQGHAAQARADFERALHRAQTHGVLATLFRRPKSLLPYHEARRSLALGGEHFRGLGVVPIDRIVGSTDRAGDFDRAFRPRRNEIAARWQSVARAYYAGKELPAVRLYQLGDAYFVIDGHHRVSVSRAMGRQFIDAEVVEVQARAAAPAGRPRAWNGWRRMLGFGSTGTDSCPCPTVLSA
jgi:hypothetical protein